jgi:hypothetical protein
MSDSFEALDPVLACCSGARYSGTPCGPEEPCPHHLVLITYLRDRRVDLRRELGRDWGSAEPSGWMPKQELTDRRYGGESRRKPKI